VLARDLLRRELKVFVATGGTASVVKAKPLVPLSIPIVFAMGADPVKLGVVTSLARPGDNITGVSFLLSKIAAKQVEVLHELVPKAAAIGFLVDLSDSSADGELQLWQRARNPHLRRSRPPAGGAIQLPTQAIDQGDLRLIGIQ
jgi:putative ABC transport system substrate-binding protein